MGRPSPIIGPSRRFPPFFRASFPATIKFAMPAGAGSPNQSDGTRFSLEWQTQKRSKIRRSARRSSAPPAKKPRPRPSAPRRAAPTRRRSRSSRAASRSAKLRLSNNASTPDRLAHRRRSGTSSGPASNLIPAQSSSCTLRLKLSHHRRNRSSLFLSIQGELRCQANCLPANPSISSSAIRKSPSTRSKKHSVPGRLQLSASAQSSAPASLRLSARPSPAAKPPSAASSTRRWPNTSFTTPHSAADPAPVRPSHSRLFWSPSSARSPAFATPNSHP